MLVGQAVWRDLPALERLQGEAAVTPWTHPGWETLHQQEMEVRS